MPISATGNSGARDSGFTLIELMVVLAIVGVMSAVVMLAMPDPRGRLVEDAERLAARAVAARDQAIISAGATRLSVDPRGYHFERQKGGRWIEIRERPLVAQDWGAGTSASLAQVDFDPTGLAAPQSRILLRRGDEQVAVDIGIDGAVHVGR